MTKLLEDLIDEYLLLSGYVQCDLAGVILNQENLKPRHFSQYNNIKNKLLQQLQAEGPIRYKGKTWSASLLMKTEGLLWGKQE